MSETCEEKAQAVCGDTPVRAPKRGKITAILLSCAIFLCGVATGGGGALIAMRHIVLSRLHNLDAPPTWMIRRLTVRLRLSSEQENRVGEILNKHKHALGTVWGEFQPRLRQGFEAMQSDVASVLNEDQAKEWRVFSEREWKTWAPPAPKTEQENGPPG